MRVRFPQPLKYVRAKRLHKLRAVKHHLLEHLDFVATGLLALTSALQTLLLPGLPEFVRVPISLTFLLLGPGYAAAAVLFPGRDDVDSAERLALTFGLSIISIPLLGLLFNTLSWGINRQSMSTGLSTLTFTVLAAALQRRLSLASKQRFFYRGAPFLRPLGLLLGIGLVCAAVVVTAQVLRPPRLATEFYVLGPEGRLEGFPQTLRSGQPFTLVVGVSNHDKETQTYRIRAPFASANIDVPELSAGQVWEGVVKLQAPAKRGRTRLTLELYRAGVATPYRSLQLFVTLTAASPPAPVVTFKARVYG